MWELRGWSGWKLAVFPCLEILLFLSFPFLCVHPLWVYPPGRVVLFALFLFHSCVCPLLPRVSASSFPLFPLVRTTDNPGLRVSEVKCTFYSSVGDGVAVRRSGSADV